MKHNNKMEQLNGEIRDREETIRGLKRRTTMLRDFKIYHSYIRPHESLDEKTSSEACGITIKGQDKWKTLIQNAKDRLSV